MRINQCDDYDDDLIKLLMATISEIFGIDHLFWSSEQKEKVQQFIEFNSHLSKIYSQQHSNQLLNIILYHKLTPTATINFDANKRLILIILLAGHIQLTKNTKNKKHERQITQQYNQQNTTIIIDSDCMVTANLESQFLFIPNSMYQSYLKLVDSERKQKAIAIISKQFPMATKKQVEQLSQFSKFAQHKINHHIYNVRDLPTYVYFLMEGNVRIEKMNHQKFANEVVVLTGKTLFGHRDISSQYRDHSAICCTAFVELLLIPKKQFLLHIKNSLPEISFLTSSKKVLKLTQQFKFPTLSLKKIRSSETPPFQKMVEQLTLPKQQQIQRQQELIKNSHTLSQRVKQINGRRFSLRSPKKNVRPSTNHSPMDTKYKLFKKLRPHPHVVDLNHRLI